MGPWVNWFLVIVGIICVIVELALGAMTGFDLALIGGSLTIGGAIGLLAGSEKIGLLAAGGLALVYLAVFRRWLKTTLTVKEPCQQCGRDRWTDRRRDQANRAARARHGESRR